MPRGAAENQNALFTRKKGAVRSTISKTTEKPLGT